jgi:short-subunit dehydrogenase
MNSLTRPLAVVTGASNGIGYELAKQFAQNGFDLFLTATGESINEAA